MRTLTYILTGISWHLLALTGSSQEHRNQQSRSFFSHQFHTQTEDGITLAPYRGKVIVMDFWYTGCGGCAGFYQQRFGPLKKEFEGDDEVVFLSLSADKNRDTWWNSVQRNIYTSETAINLYTGAAGFQHPLLIACGINRFPHLLIIDKDGLVAHQVRKPRSYSMAELAKLIHNAK